MEPDLFHQPEPPAYHDTTRLDAQLLSDAILAAKEQDDIVMAVMKVRKKMSPSMLIPYFKTNTPITSIRRSISNLTRAGKLQKLDEQTMGGYGKPEHYWKYIEP